MRGLKLLLAAVPFRQQDAVGQHQVVIGLGRQVEVEAHPAGRGLVVVGDAEDVEVVGGLFRVLVFIFVERTVDLDEFGPGKQALGAKQQHEGVGRLRHVDTLRAPLALVAAVCRPGIGRRRRLVAGLTLLAGADGRLRVQP